MATHNRHEYQQVGVMTVMYGTKTFYIKYYKNDLVGQITN